MIPRSVKEQYAIPRIDGVVPFYFALDGGGRDLIVEAMWAHEVRTMVEIGCFLCGSTIQWLKARPELEIVGIDPWSGRWDTILERYVDNPVFESCWSGIGDRQAVIASVRENGAFRSAMANVQLYRDRFFAVPGRSPEELHTLKTLGVAPDMLYFDSEKVLDDLVVAHQLFPGAILCGDDWTWGKDQGYPVRKAVHAFCNDHGYEVEARRATWLLHKG